MSRVIGSRLVVVLLVALVATSAIGAAAAYGWWTAIGTATGSAPTGSLIALTTTASTPSGTTLVPSETAPLVITVTNPNPMPLVVTSVQLDPDRAVEVSGSVGSCVAPPLTVDAATSLSLAAESTATLTLPDAVALGASAASGCQGATFTIPVTLSGATS